MNSRFEFGVRAGWRIGIRIALRCGIFLLPALPGMGAVKLPALFAKQMVLQRDQPIPVWGWADPGEAITVKLGEGERATTAGADGSWKVVLPARSAATGLKLSIVGSNSFTFDEVSVGEVWLCAGQSNMVFPLSRLKDAEREIAQADFPNIRIFKVGMNPQPTPQTETKGRWVACNPAEAKNVSAVAYYFARELNEELQVPIGVILSAAGGSPAESWLSPEAIQAVPDARPYLEEWGNLLAEYPAAAETYEKKLFPEWLAASAQAKAEGKPVPPRPAVPLGPMDSKHPGNLFNGMIAPLIPFSIRGVIWYQGESNAPRASAYGTLLPALIQDWRSRWGQGDFPFLLVQLPNFKAPQTRPVEAGDWPTIRESQAEALKLPHTGMICAIDLADPENPADIHPHNKRDVASRLAGLALAEVYGQKVIGSGPVFTHVKVAGNALRVSFAHTDGGLMPKEGGLKGFAIAGADGKWEWADAVIDGDEVVLSHPAIPQPVNARYAWASNPIGNLRNGAGWPAFPFRTDRETKN